MSVYGPVAGPSPRRPEVLERLQGVECATHRNDALRALAEVPILAASLGEDAAK
jgi:hypothetical protein